MEGVSFTIGEIKLGESRTFLADLVEASAGRPLIANSKDCDEERFYRLAPEEQERIVSVENNIKTIGKISYLHYIVFNRIYLFSVVAEVFVKVVSLMRKTIFAPYLITHRYHPPRT